VLRGREGKTFHLRSFLRALGGYMGVNQCFDLAYIEAEAPNASAKVYDFRMRQAENRRQRRIRALEHENALLAGVLSETSNEIAQLRKLLTAP
jgi:hypothetical protein